MQSGPGIFLRCLSVRTSCLPRFEVTAKPLLEAPHSKAFRYAAMLQRLNRHTPLPVLFYYYTQGRKICQLFYMQNCRMNFYGKM